MIVEIRFLVVFPILASLYTSYYFSWSDRNLEPKLEHIVHLLPNFLLFVYGIFVFAKSVVYLDANHSNLPVAHDAGFIVSEAFTWMVLYVSCPSSSLQKSFYVVVIWYLYYGICTVYYGKELGIDQNFMGGSTYFLTVATPSLGLFMITCIYKSILLKEELKLRLVRKFEMDRIEEKQSTIESVLMSAITPTIYEKMKDGDIELFEHHQDVALAVLDVVSFTSMTKRFLPSDMVGFASNILNYLEEVCERHDVDFIKSCGDSYLVRGSLGKSADDALKSILHFANDVHTGAPTIDMSAQAPEISFRIAVHRGSCTSGVIGRSRFSYDIWGRTMLHTQTLQRNCVAGRTRVSEHVRDILEGKGEFEFDLHIGSDGRQYYAEPVRDIWKVYMRHVDWLEEPAVVHDDAPLLQESLSMEDMELISERAKESISTVPQ
eukprot:TRINITY_DN4133_c0_g1_i5.p1 TRINITY_DN4133_c0_g1~~TRINITY_DN4133_c0_g1_i5.p1  ORF type:complete len:434 (-),score=78.61 TRINITY_DN4133_c0_g1_i5:192-1493(-)